MADFDLKVPSSQEEMDQIYAMLRSEISDDDLENVVGGNDDLKGKGTFTWTCGGCGATIVCKSTKDAAKHMTKCPKNPYKR